MTPELHLVSELCMPNALIRLIASYSPCCASTTCTSQIVGAQSSCDQCHSLCWQCAECLANCPTCTKRLCSECSRDNFVGWLCDEISPSIYVSPCQVCGKMFCRECYGNGDKLFHCPILECENFPLCETCALVCNKCKTGFCRNHCFVSPMSCDK